MCCRRYECKFNDFEPQHNKIELDKPKSYNITVREKYYEDLDLSNLSQRRIAYKTLCSGVVKGVDIYHNSLEYADNTIKYDWLKEFISNIDEKIIVFDTIGLSWFRGTGRIQCYFRYIRWQRAAVQLLGQYRRGAGRTAYRKAHVARKKRSTLHNERQIFGDEACAK